MIRIISPTDGSSISVLTHEQEDFIVNTVKRQSAQAHAFDYLNLIVEGIDRTQPEPVTFCWESDTEYSEYQLVISEEPSFCSVQTFLTTEKCICVYNLPLGKKYYFQIQAGEEVSAVFSFMLSLDLPRCIHAPGLVNVRDVGGWNTSSGKRVQQGLLYRGCKMELAKSGKPPFITDEGRKVLAEQLQIKTDIDLRADSVDKLDKSELWEFGVQYKILPCRSYEEFFMDDCAQSNKQIFETLADESIYPAYIHCWGGADRTSMIIFMLGSILGISEEDMLLDYEYTSLAIWGIRSRNGDYIQNFKDSLAKYGDGRWYENAIAYLRSIGVTDETMQRIRNIFLED